MQLAAGNIIPIGNAINVVCAYRKLYKDVRLYWSTWYVKVDRISVESMEFPKL